MGTSVLDHLAALAEGQPSMCIANFFAPHPPFYVPQRFLDLYDPAELPLPALDDQERAEQPNTPLTDDRLRAIKHGYFGAISELDHHIGRILTGLDSLGRADRTIVILVSDHGEWFGDHLRLAKGYPADDPVTRVPLVMRWPRGVTRPGRRVEDIVELVDIAITEHERWTSVRSSTHHYVVREDGRELLWDMTQDPTEHHELAHGQPLGDHNEAALSGTDACCYSDNCRPDESCREPTRTDPNVSDFLAQPTGPLASAAAPVAGRPRRPRARSRDTPRCV